MCLANSQNAKFSSFVSAYLVLTHAFPEGSFSLLALGHAAKLPPLPLRASVVVRTPWVSSHTLRAVSERDNSHGHFRPAIFHFHRSSDAGTSQVQRPRTGEPLRSRWLVCQSE